MITIRPRFRRPGIVIPWAAIACFCLSPVVFKPVSAAAVAGLGSLAVMVLIGWIMTRPIRLEITETEVRARQGGWGYQTDKQAPRSEICAIRYYPSRISFRGPDDQPLMEPADVWTVREMLKAAEVLQVPLYDHRGLLKLEKLSEGRLVYDPAFGPVVRRKLPVPGAVRGRGGMGRSQGPIQYPEFGMG